MSRWKVLTPDEVAAVLRRPRRTVLDYLNRGELKGVKRGQRWFIREEALDEFLAPDSDSPRADTA